MRPYNPQLLHLQEMQAAKRDDVLGQQEAPDRFRVLEEKVDLLLETQSHIVDAILIVMDMCSFLQDQFPEPEENS